jgi:hypothetical protein
VLNAMALLSKLGSVHYPVTGGGPASTARLGGIATLNPSVAAVDAAAPAADGDGGASKQSADLSTRFPGENEAAVVLYSSDDSAPSNPSGLTIVNLTLTGLPAGANKREKTPHFESTPYRCLFQTIISFAKTGLGQTQRNTAESKKCVSVLSSAPWDRGCSGGVAAR